MTGYRYSSQMYFALCLTLVLNVMPHSGAKAQISRIDSVKSLLVPPKDTVYARNLAELARLYISDGQGDSALGYADQAYALSIELGFQRGQARALLVKGKHEVSSYRPLDKATGLILQSLDIFTSIRDFQGVAECNLQLGVLSFDIQNYEDAISYLQKTLDYQFGNNRLKAVSHYLLAISYSELSEFERAHNMFDLARQEFEGDEHFQLQIESFTGKLYLNQGDYKTAILLFNDVLAKYLAKFEEENFAPTYAYLGSAYLKLEEYEKAVKISRRAYDLAKGKGSFIIYLREAEETLNKAYRALGDNDSAYYFLNELSQIKDSIYNNRVLQRVAVMKGVNEFEQLLKNEKAEQALKEAINKQELDRAQLIRNIFMLGFLLVVVFAGMFFYQRNKIALGKQRSDELLRNILPFETAEELKATGTAEAKHIDLVSVLFTDFVGFTQIAEKLSPTHLVQEINVYFSAFDTILDKYGIEKIKTIGDAYMAAGGLPRPKDNSVKNTILAALEIQEYIKNTVHKAGESERVEFKMRVGVHTGPVVAGIVGLKKFQYDIWGDTVNTANRMEEHSVPGKVNISESTYVLVKDEPEFAFSFRGKMQVKGKGEINMYFVDRI